jgi:hypothetical protein
MMEVGVFLMLGRGGGGVAVNVYSSLYAKSKSKLATGHPLDLRIAKKTRDGSHRDNFDENL